MSDKLPPKVLVIEPDEVLNATLCNNIERYWFDVARATNGDRALRSAEVHKPNLAIISSRIQDYSAKEMALRLRKIASLEKLPIIYLIEQEESVQNYQNEEQNFIEVLQRPISSTDLMTTIRALLRKSKPIFQDKILKYNDIRMDLSTYRVHRKNRQVNLGPTEFKILQLFMQSPKSLYSRQQIIDYVWGPDKDIAARTIDVHINRIRTLMKLETDRHQIIKTIRSAGYCLD